VRAAWIGHSTVLIRVDGFTILTDPVFSRRIGIGIGPYGPESCQVGPANVRAFEVRHWGARTRTDVHRGYNGYLIEAGRYRIVFGGDTAYIDSFRTIRSSRPVNLAIMPIGAYDPWIHAHCNPEQALAMANHAGADFVLPVHHQTFKLSNEPNREPIERLLLASGSAEDRIPIREIGDEFQLGAPR
jgi:L-ascorbate metabolism protein UlaG (beta-lactamase superfamily)